MPKNLLMDLYTLLVELENDVARQSIPPRWTDPRIESIKDVQALVEKMVALAKA